MKKNKAILVYLLGTFIQLVSVCLVFFLLNRYSVQSNVLTISGIILGGISSALWGIIVANRYFHIHFKKILKDFFNIHTSYKHYLLSFFLIIFDFSFILFGGKIIEFSWYLPFLMFFKFILFGGIEEIGWRYVFQPILQENLPYFLSTILTFFSWAIWHLLYFYIDGSLAILQLTPFLIGLLTNSFILSALYIKTNNLWICVMTHSIINVLSQLTIDTNQYETYLIKIFVILVSCYMVMNKKEEYSRN